MRIKIIAGNWKMNKDLEESVDLAGKLADNLAGLEDREVLLCPPFVNLKSVKDVIEGSGIKLGAQNVHFEREGAFTGEISPRMLKAVGCEYVIIGHSERRAVFNEDDGFINKKLRAVLKEGMSLIFCVGETLYEREAGILFPVVERQLKKGLHHVSLEDVKKVVIAYEPVWAIGTGKVATTEQAEEMHKFIRGLLRRMYDDETADSIRIQYGGSVKPDNISGLMAEPDIDGALVGGASLDADSFTRIVLYDKDNP